jgi:hypothetical protein
VSRYIDLAALMLLLGCNGSPQIQDPIIIDSSILSEPPCATDGSCQGDLICVRITATERRCVDVETVCPRIDCGKYVCNVVSTSENRVVCGTLEDGGLP